MKSKRGSLMIEGAIVIPIIILIAISTVFYGLFQYENFHLQLRIHEELLETCSKERLVTVVTEEKTRENSIDLGGLTKDILTKRIEGQKYVINFGKSVRTFCMH